MSSVHPYPTIYVSPLQGVEYLSSNFGKLGQHIAGPITNGIVLSTITIYPLFKYVFLPQAKWAGTILGHTVKRGNPTALTLLAATTGAILCIVESHALWNHLTGHRLARIPEELLWDETIRDKGIHIKAFVETEEEAMRSASFRNGFLAQNSLLSVSALEKESEKGVERKQTIYERVMFVVSIPLQFVPFVGAPSFLYLNSLPKAGRTHRHYFTLKGLTPTQRRRWLSERRRAYLRFGMVSTVLELIPIMGIVFACGNRVAAALWAVELEEADQNTSLEAQSYDIQGHYDVSEIEIEA